MKRVGRMTTDRANRISHTFPTVSSTKLEDKNSRYAEYHNQNESGKMMVICYSLNTVCSMCWKGIKMWS